MSVITKEPQGNIGCQRVDEDEEGYQEEDAGNLHQRKLNPLSDNSGAAWPKDKGQANGKKYKWK